MRVWDSLNQFIFCYRGNKKLKVLEFINEDCSCMPRALGLPGASWKQPTTELCRLDFIYVKVLFGGRFNCSLLSFEERNIHKNLITL